MFGQVKILLPNLQTALTSEYAIEIYRLRGRCRVKTNPYEISSEHVKIVMLRL